MFPIFIEVKAVGSDRVISVNASRINFIVEQFDNNLKFIHTVIVFSGDEENCACSSEDRETIHQRIKNAILHSKLT